MEQSPEIKQIPDVKSTIKAIQDNNEAMVTIVNGTMSTIASITAATKDTKMLKSNILLLQVSNCISSYMEIVNSIASTLASTYDKNGVQLSEILGCVNSYVVENGAVKLSDKPKFSNIEALFQIKALMSEMSTFMQDLAKMDLGIKAVFKIQKNMRTFCKTIKQLIYMMVKELSSILTDQEIQDLALVLMGDPNTIMSDLDAIDKNDKSSNNNNKDNKALITYLENTQKDLESGKKIGIIEALTKTFSLFSSFVDFKLPNFIAFQLKLIKFKIQLKSLFRTFDEVLQSSVDTTSMSQFSKTLSDLSTVIENIGEILKQLTKITTIKHIVVLAVAGKMFDLFNSAMTKLGEVLSDKNGAFKKLSDPSLTPMLEDCLTNIKLISSIFRGLVIIGLLALPLLLLAIPLLISLALMKVVFMVIEWVFKNVNNIDTSAVESILVVFKSLLKIQLAIIAISLLAKFALKAMLIDVLFLLALIPFLYVVKFTLDIISKIGINAKINRSVKTLLMFFLNIVRIQLAIIAIAILALPAMIAMVIDVIFLFALIPFLGIMKMILWVIGKIVIDRKMKKDMRELAMLMLSLVYIQLAIIALALLTKPTIIAMVIVAMFLISLVLFLFIVKIALWVIGFVIDRKAKKNMRELLLMILALALVEALIIIMGAFAIQAIKSLILCVVFIVSLLVFVIILSVFLLVVGKLIKGGTYKNMIELTIMIGMLLVIAVLLVMISKLYESMSMVAVVGTAVIVLVAAVLLMAISTIATSLGTQSLIGLAILIAVIGLFVVAALLLTIVTSMYDKITLEATAGTAGILLVVAGLLIAIGALGLASVIAIPGLTILIINLGLLLAAASLVEEIEKLEITDKSKKIIKTVSSIVGDLIVLGMKGLAAVLACALMPSNVSLISSFYNMATKLNEINKYDIDGGNIKGKIKTVKMLIGMIENTFGKIKLNAKLRKARRTINSFTSILRPIKRLMRKINSISKIKLDEAKAIAAITKIFNTVTNLQNHINTLSEDNVKKNEDGSLDWRATLAANIEESIKFMASKKKLDRSDKILQRVYSIATKLNKIQEIEIEYEKIEKNLEHILGDGGILSKIEEFVNEQNRLPDDWSGKDLVNMFKSNIADSLQYKAANGKLERSDVILARVYNIAKSLDDIQKIEFNPEQLSKKLGFLFKVVDEIDRVLEERTQLSAEKQNSFIDNWKMLIKLKQQEQLRDADAANIDRISSILGTIGNIANTLKDIVALELKEGEAEQKVRTFITESENISKIISELDENGVTAQMSSDSFNIVVDHIKSLNTELKGIAGLSTQEVSTVKTTLDHYSKFLTKVDGLKVANLEHATKMFEQMARFSESISGNFDMLAESLNENIMPTLEELKEILEKMPEAIGEATPAPQATNTNANANQNNQSPSNNQKNNNQNETQRREKSDLKEIINILKGNNGAIRVRTI